MNKQQKNAGEVVTGLEEVVLDDGIHPFVANIKMSEFKMRFYTVETHFKKQHLVISDRRTISFSKIVSIQHIQNTNKKYRKDDFRTLKFELNDAHFTRIFLRERAEDKSRPPGKPGKTGGDVISSVDLITCGFSRLHVQMTSLWHAQRLRAALCIDDKYGHTEAELAAEYYKETVASLREVEKQKSPLADQVEILHEFADEVVSDIDLKIICFKSKELFIMLFKMYASVLAAPDHKMVHMKNKALVMTDMSAKNKADVEIEETIFKRLLLFHAIIKVMHAILVSSQSIESRFDVFSWARPLVLDSWVDVLLTDVYEELCHLLGFKFGALNDAEVNFEINKSFENVSISTPKRKKALDRSEGTKLGGSESAFYSTNKITNVFSDDLLSPLRQRVQKQFALFGVDHRSKLALLVRSIKDLQTMLAFCCVDACVTGRQAYQKNGDVVYPPPSLRMVDSMVRMNGWESFVEDVMIRISNILDDMLVLDSVVRVIKKRFWQPGHTPRLISARAHPSLASTPPVSYRESLSRSFSFDNGNHGVFSPRVGAVPALERVRMSPSPRSRNRKKMVKQTSFKELSLDGTARGDRINTIFETQEVMLHNACCLIRIMVLDHSKVRSFLVHDIDNHWFGIMHSMNLLFPRPEVPKETVKDIDIEKSEKKSALFTRLFSKTNRDKKKETSEPPAPTTDDENDNKNKTKAGKDKTAKGTEDKEDGAGTAKEEEAEEEPMVTRLKKVRKETAQVNLHEYGPPLYEHFTTAGWEMCLLARRAIEESIELLDLDIQFYHENKQDEDEDVDKVEDGEKAVKKPVPPSDSASGGDKGREKGSAALHSRLVKPPLNANNLPHTELNSATGRAPTSNANDSKGAGTGDSSAGISMTKRTTQGHHYDVTVPLLTLPKKINDSFEKRLLGGDGNGNSKSSSSGHADGQESANDRSSRIAARFKRK